MITHALDRVGDAGQDAAQVANHPVVLWALIIFAVISILAQAVPKIATMLGPLGKWITSRTDRQRRIALDRDDADIADLRRQVTNLTTWRTEQEERNRAHTEWDRRAYAELVKAGIDIDVPPSLF